MIARALPWSLGVLNLAPAMDARGQDIVLIALSQGASCLYVADFFPPETNAVYRELADETPWDTNVDAAERSGAGGWWGVWGA